MLIDVSIKEFKQRFCSDPHPFISEEFIGLNKKKTDKIVRLIEDKPRAGIGLIAGISDGILKSPFSAPFGGFHYRNESIYISEIEQFLDELLNYSKSEAIKQINLTLSPSLYQRSINAKLVNSMIRQGFEIEFPDITHWIELKKNKGKISQCRRRYYRQAIENNLTFYCITDNDEKRLAYEIIFENRVSFGRPIHMTFEDIIKISELWPVDFFCVKNPNGKMVASGIMYQFPLEISYAVFWGDNKTGRALRAMDFLISNLLSYYNSMGFKYIDFGTSTKSGIPNEGLLRFKETHDCISDLRFSFSRDI